MRGFDVISLIGEVMAEAIEQSFGIKTPTVVHAISPICGRGGSPMPFLPNMCFPTSKKQEKIR
jgi:hypothetical protein